jgi:hypothetical protein
MAARLKELFPPIVKLATARMFPNPYAGKSPAAKMTSGPVSTIAQKSGHKPSQNIFFSYYAENEALARFPSKNSLSRHTAVRYLCISFRRVAKDTSELRANLSSPRGVRSVGHQIPDN